MLLFWSKRCICSPHSISTWSVGRPVNSERKRYMTCMLRFSSLAVMLHSSAGEGGCKVVCQGQRKAHG